MWDLGLILIPIMFGFFCLIGAATLGEHHSPLRIGLFLLSFISIFGALYMGSMVLNADKATITEALANMTNWFTWIFVVIVLYFMIYLFYTLTHIMGGKKGDEDIGY